MLNIILTASFIGYVIYNEIRCKKINKRIDTTREALTLHISNMNRMINSVDNLSNSLGRVTACVDILDQDLGQIKGQLVDTERLIKKIDSSGLFWLL